MESVRIIDKKIQAHLKVFQALAFDALSDTLWPELYRIFGRAAAIKFIDVFAGTRVEIPDRQVLDEIARDTDIYISLSKGKTIDELATRYDISATYVSNIYARAKASIERFHAIEGEDDG